MIQYATTFGHLAARGPSRTTPRPPDHQPGWSLACTEAVHLPSTDTVMLIWTWERAVTAAKSAPRPPRKTREQLRRLMRLVEKH